MAIHRATLEKVFAVIAQSVRASGEARANMLTISKAPDPMFSRLWSPLTQVNAPLSRRMLSTVLRTRKDCQVQLFKTSRRGLDDSVD